jgi:hypothetical protein
MDQYKGKNYGNLDRLLVKKLIGSMTNMYDKQLQSMGFDPKALRKLESAFMSDCKPVGEKTYQQFLELRKVSFNYFHSVDASEVPDGWTDYGDEDYSHTGLRIEEPFRIVAVKFREYFDPVFGRRDITFEEEREITSMEVFCMMGTEPFRRMADLVDWETIIRSF